jgi:predicted metal-dependent HD superfamily phosphohydrolase
MVNSSLEGFLREVWAAHVSHLTPNKSETDAVFTHLVRAYAEPHRFYHTLEHLREVLLGISVIESVAEHRSAVDWAGWFHDVVYDPRAHDNEERSAEIAARELKRIGVNETEIALVRELILATRHAEGPDPKPDFQVLLDADLGILGSPPPRYQRYAADIRREYAHVPDADYRKGRTAVLTRFLERPRIYHTATMFENHEQQARVNLASEIEALTCD